MSNTLSATLPGTEGEDLLKSINFIRTWCHDIGSYLGMMRSLINLIDEVGPERLPELSGLLHTTCRLMEDIHENIREYTRGRTGLTLQRVDVQEALNDMVAIYSGMAQSYGVCLTLEQSSGVCPNIITDRLKFNQTLSNLISNAIKFSRTGMEVRVTAVQQDALIISVVDAGIGIPADKLNDIFKPYTRLNEDYPGTGLGLTNCKRFMEEIGGKLTVISKPGEGSTFTVIIPVL